MQSPKRIGYVAALSIVVANMIGTGVFTSLGFQVGGTTTGFALLALWVVGGVMALCGSLAYGELAAALPRSGGEYHYLSRVYHPLLGFVAGWVSVAVGFAAPIALAAMALGSYAATIVPVSATAVAAGTVLLLTAVHSGELRVGKDFQVASTAVKLVLIVFFIVAGLLHGAPTELSFVPTRDAVADVFTPAFAVSLIFVGYAFTGWNAATYMAGEVEDPQRTLPRTLLHGTLLVTALYVLLNFVFLRSVPLADLAGKVEVGAISAERIFGVSGGQVMSGMLCLILVSTISAMVLVGPRVVRAIAEDLPVLAPFARVTGKGAPRNAILLQQGLALAFIFTGSFEAVLSYAGILLTLCTLLTVAGVYVLRVREPGLARPYRTWGYPVTPALYIGVSAWTLFYVAQANPAAAVASVVTLAIGLGLGVLGRRLSALPAALPTPIPADVDPAVAAAALHPNR